MACPCLRITKEWAWLTDLAAECPGFVISNVSSNESLPQTWKVQITSDNAILKGSLYEGQAYDLVISLDISYPSTAPVVIFGEKVPEHVHIYSNGMICLEPLYAGWRKDSSVKALVLDILVMLKETQPHQKRKPSNDAFFSPAYPRGTDPRRLGWIYEDVFETGAPVASTVAATTITAP